MRNTIFDFQDIGTLCLSLMHQFHAGIGLGDALALTAEDETVPRRKDVLSAMARDADSGMGISAVFGKTGCFPAYVCGLLEVGSRVGKTEETLEALAQHYENRARLQRGIRESVLYPAVLAATMLAVVMILLIWVLPIFDDVYALMGSGLTGLAGGLLLLGKALRRILPYLLGALALGVILAAISPLRQRIAALWRTKNADRGVGREISTARFLQGLSLGLQSGMTMEEALRLSLELTEGSAFRRRCENCLSLLNDGADPAAALCDAGLISRAERRLLQAGGRSGRTETAMETIARQRLERSEDALKRKVRQIEPALVLVTSLLIGVILLAVMLPMMHIMTGIG